MSNQTISQESIAKLETLLQKIKKCGDLPWRYEYAQGRALDGSLDEHQIFAEYTDNEGVHHHALGIASQGVQGYPRPGIGDTEATLIKFIVEAVNALPGLLAQLKNTEAEHRAAHKNFCLLQSDGKALVDTIEKERAGRVKAEATNLVYKEALEHAEFQLSAYVDDNTEAYRKVCAALGLDPVKQKEWTNVNRKPDD